jgi:hypothetical protein
LGLDAAGRANGIVHLTRGTTATVTAAAVATAATVTAAATALFRGIAAGLALARGLKPFALVECLLFLGEHETFTADGAREFLGCHNKKDLIRLTWDTNRDF